MAGDALIRTQLADNNPFISSASPLPWENMNPDLQQLSRSTSEEIEQLLRHKRREPTLPLAGLILGEAGSGKTHMLMRILRRLRANARPAIFVAVKTFRDPGSVTQHLLSEIFISLKRTHSNGRIQFDMLLSELMNTYSERRRNDGFTDLSKVDLRTYLARDMPNLDRNFLKCLLIYMGTNDETVKTDILDWLNEGLDDNECLKLGLPVKDMNSMTDARRESVAGKTLISLGLVLAYAKVPMVICFDQLDAMKDRTLIEAWGNIINLLMNDLSGILPLCFVRAETWNDIFLPVLDDAVTQRLRNNTMIMNTCTLAQAQQLIHDRIAGAFDEDVEAKYQWLLEAMSKSLRSGLSPRTIIELANKAITDLDSPAITPPVRAVLNQDAIRTIYEDECRKVDSEPGSWPPNSDQLALALQVWLESHDGFTVSEGDGKTLKMCGTYGKNKFAFIIVTSKSHFVATAGFKKGISFLQENPGGFCFYITETRTHKATWKLANERRTEFQNLGGRYILLDKSGRTQWYGLTSMLNRIDNGDVNLYPSSQPKTATREDIRDFIRTIRLLTIRTNEPDKRLSENLRAIISSSPMNLISIDKAAELLRQQSINASRDDILSFVREHLDVFRIFQSRNEVLVTFRSNS